MITQYPTFTSCFSFSTQSLKILQPIGHENGVRRGVIRDNAAGYAQLFAKVPHGFRAICRNDYGMIIKLLDHFCERRQSTNKCRLAGYRSGRNQQFHPDLIATTFHQILSIKCSWHVSALNHSTEIRLATTGSNSLQEKMFMYAALSISNV